MEKIRQKVDGFLKDQGMHSDDIDMETTCGVFLEEMAKGLAGRDSSLAMLPTYIETERAVPRNTPVIVMDAGGTNFRVAAVTFRDDGQPVIENQERYSMPGMKREVGKDEFFRTMAGYVEKVLDTSNSIGFCFSYPIEMFPSKDGRVLFFSKEIKAPQVEGQMIGANLNAASACG